MKTEFQLFLCQVGKIGWFGTKQDYKWTNLSWLGSRCEGQEQPCKRLQFVNTESGPNDEYVFWVQTSHYKIVIEAKEIGHMGPITLLVFARTRMDTNEKH